MFVSVVNTFFLLGRSRSVYRGCRAVLFNAAAPLHIPSWIRLLNKQSLRLHRPDTYDSNSTVSPTHGRLNHSNARLSAESMGFLRLTLRGEGFFFTRKKCRYNRPLLYFVAPVLYSCKSHTWFPLAPSVFAVALAYTRRRRLPGRGDGEGGRGGTPFVEPEPTLNSTSCKAPSFRERSPPHRSRTVACV